MGEPVSEMCDHLIKAVNVMMDAESSQIYRLEALKFCEEFKEKCPFCVPCGLQLADKAQTAVNRFRWNNMPQQEKVQLKNCAMGLLSTGTYPILEEESHIKDVLARIIVEMIKREWPQHWPDMLKEMEALTSIGEAQTELVMLILLRLAEDVITFQTLPTQRRRDIQQTLTQNMESIFSFLLTILQLHVDEYRKLKKIPGQELQLKRLLCSVFCPSTRSLSSLPTLLLPSSSLLLLPAPSPPGQAKAHCRVGVAALNTLAGYIDWVALAHLTNDNCRLLEILCLLLSETELQLEAAECLLIAISRKGKLEDRKPLMVLFDDVAMHYILSAAQSADGAATCNKSSPTQPVAGLVERHYTFLKRLCQVLCSLGSQLCFLVGSDVEVEVPANLSKYTEAFLAFTTHPSQFLRSSTQIMNDSPSCEYSRHDFDSDEDFNSFFNSFRAQQGEAVRNACRIVPLEGFQIAAEWLQYQISTPIDIGTTVSKMAEGLCSILSPSAVQWDAMTFFTESVVGQMFKNVEVEKLPVDQGIELLQAVLNYNTQDPLILSCVLTNLSSLFPFVTHRPHFLPQVLYKLFASITFEVVEESKAPRTRAVKNVRRHACSSIIKMSRDYPWFILPCFDILYNQVKKLFSNEALLTQMEKCALIEALVLISNHVLWDPALFLAFVGADQLVAEGTDHTTGINRSRLSFCVYTILGVVKRARWPADLEEAKAGGFVVGYTPTGAPIYRNPCTSQVLAMLPNLLALIRAYEVIEVERNQLVLSCPPEYYDSLLCPLLGPLFAYMLQRLNISMEEDEDEVCEEKQVTQEMLEEQLVPHACILKKAPEPAGNKEDVDDEEMMSTESQAVTANPAQPTGEMTELGKCLLKHEVVGGNLLPEAVTWFYASVLKGLQMHGQHEVCNSALTQLALVIYENLRPRYLELRSVMTQIPSINLEALDQYDQRLLEPSSAQKVGEKKRKDQFKKLISGTVGKALGQQFKKEVHIRNLPSLFKKPKPEKRDIVEPSESGALAALFSPTRDNI
ncbi:unnamed protein product [Coregonus sp. 'balchen']|nr:unnamed protein product [Coregonus sp. 'balchen']